jgi:thiamine biosynthesis lipoprotein ApbE
MRALNWILIAVGPLVVVFAFAFPAADARRRSRSQVALTMARTGMRSVGFGRQP